MIEISGRFVGVLFGPPGAGKSTAAQLFGVEILDRDLEPWASAGEAAFTTALEQLAVDRSATAAVIRTGATDSARRRALTLADATHAWILATPRQLCHERVELRGRDPRAEHAGIERWWKAYQPSATIPTWPAGHEVDLAAARVTAAARGPMLAPMCGRCDRRHLPTLPCWTGRYAQRVKEHCFRVHGRLCWQCRRAGRTTLATTVDHVIARSLGGTDELGNTEPSCAPCNIAKSNRSRDPYGDQPHIAGNGRPISPRFR